MYPNAAVLPLFEKYFKRSNSLLYICTVGFEPNPAHEKQLKGLNDAYNACGWKTKIYTNTAVSNEDGFAYFFTDHDTDNLEWGGTIIDPSDEKYGRFKDDQLQGQKINVIRLSKFINEKVATRKIPGLNPAEYGQPTVFIKMDIEGSELEVLHDMVLEGSFAHVDAMMVEFHEFIAVGIDRRQATRHLKNFVQEYAKFYSLIESKPIDVLDADDESYYLSNFTLPIC